MSIIFLKLKYAVLLNSKIIYLQHCSCGIYKVNYTRWTQTHVCISLKANHRKGTLQLLKQVSKYIALKATQSALTLQERLELVTGQLTNILYLKLQQKTLSVSHLPCSPQTPQYICWDLCKMKPRILAEWIILQNHSNQLHPHLHPASFVLLSYPSFPSVIIFYRKSEFNFLSDKTLLLWQASTQTFKWVFISLR